jgi:hypothetical protein
VQILFRVLNTLADCVGYLARFTKPEATMPLPSPTTNKRRELKNATPFTVLETRLIATTRSVSSYLLASIKSQKYPSFLEFEAAFTSRFSKLFHTSVINIAATVEDNILNAFSAAFFASAAPTFFAASLFTAKTFEILVH